MNINKRLSFASAILIALGALRLTPDFDSPRRMAREDKLRANRKRRAPKPGERALERYQDRYTHVMTPIVTENNLRRKAQRKKMEAP